MLDVDDLPKLKLCPLLDSYNVAMGDNVISTQYSAGMPRQRSSGSPAPASVELTFRHNEFAQSYMMSFWRLHKTKPFAMRLIVDDAPADWYACRFAASPNIRHLGAGIYEFAVPVHVQPKRPNPTDDQSIVDLFDTYGPTLSPAINKLETLVNESLPDALGDL